MKMKYIIVGMLAVIFTAGCKKEFDGRAPEDANLASHSFVRFFAGSMGAARNFISIDNQRLNGTALAMGGFFPGASTVTAFITVPAGSRSVSIIDTALVGAQSPVSFTQNFLAGQYYSIFTYDTSNAVKALVTNDAFTIPTDTTCNLRFVNVISSTTPVPNVDVFSRARGANIITNIPTLGVSSFIAHRTGVNDTLDIRQTGTTTILASVNGFTFNLRRTYTLVFRGRYQATSGTMSRGANIMATY
ncbi:MAG: hypothetical protein RL596_196 [Bacteroidota bacterium]|jgi:hypothetical protein